MMKRRTLLQVGVLGAAGLGVLAWLQPSRPVLSPDGAELFGALAPIVIGAACATPQDRQRAVEGVKQAIARLSPAAQAEVGELVQLLSLAPTRALVAGVWTSWSQATPESLQAFLQRWRTSRIGLLQSGYHALHDLILGGWYADPQAWAAIGYAGPPRLNAPA